MNSSPQEEFQTENSHTTFISLASGSKGNCLLWESGNDRFLVDAGISCRMFEERLKNYSFDIRSCHGILVTHEHTDHILGLKRIAQKYNLKVFCNRKTAEGIMEFFPGESFAFRIFTTGQPFVVGGVEVASFSILHDTPDPVGFVLQNGRGKMGVCADLGFVTPIVIRALKGCQSLYLEANHEPSFVHASPRPESYKQRVLGRYGHLSNQQSAELLLEIADQELQWVVLGHLSEECNHPERAEQTIKEHLDYYGITLSLKTASQQQPLMATTQTT